MPGPHQAHTQLTPMSSDRLHLRHHTCLCGTEYRSFQGMPSRTRELCPRPPQLPLLPPWLASSRKGGLDPGSNLRWPWGVCLQCQGLVSGHVI